MQLHGCCDHSLVTQTFFSVNLSEDIADAWNNHFVIIKQTLVKLRRDYM